MRVTDAMVRRAVKQLWTQQHWAGTVDVSALLVAALQSVPEPTVVMVSDRVEGNWIPYD